MECQVELIEQLHLHQLPLNEPYEFMYYKL